MSSTRRRPWFAATAAVLSTGLLMSGWQTMAASGAEGPDPLDSGTLTAGSHAEGHGVSAADDGDGTSYWKSGKKSDWIQTDLGATRRLDRAVLELPGGAQTFKVEGSTNGADFTDLSEVKARKGTVAVQLDGAATRYLRVTGAQRVAEIEVYEASAGDARPPSAPGGVTLDGAGLSWKSADDDTKVVAYDIYADGTLRTSVPAKTTTWKDGTAAAGSAEKVTYEVRARDAAGNQSADSDAVRREAKAGTQAPKAAVAKAKAVKPTAGATDADRKRSTKKIAAADRGAVMPYTTVEAEAGTAGGGAEVVGPNREIGDLGGEASGRQAVTLNEEGQYVEFTNDVATNTLVTRFSIPDAPGGGGIDATLNVYVDGELLAPIELTSKYAWLYGAEASPGNDPGSGEPRHIYDEAQLDLGQTVPAGSTIRLQKDADNTSEYAIDFVDFEQAAEIANPDPGSYVEPAGFTHQDVQNALDEARMDESGDIVGVYLPPGDYETTSKFQVYGKPVQVIGAGPWYTKFHAPSGQENTDIGFRAEAATNGSTFSGFAYYGNYTSRIDGPGKVFDFANVSDITIENVWAEHMICLYWGANTDNMTVQDSRFRNLFADGLNMTNGSTDNLVSNNEARSTGDDSFALFSAIDAGGADETDNVYENLTSLLTWRAAGLAVYGGYNNTFRNIYIADNLVYSGITISSLDFGYPMNGFGPDPTNFQDITVERAGGHFWNGQTFPGIWLFSASKPFQGIRLDNVDIIDPTYHGIMFQTNYVGSQAQNPVEDTLLENITISGAKKSGDEYDDKSGFGIWANPLPEEGQGPAVGEATFRNLTLSGNDEDIRNDTDTFEIIVE